MQKRSEIIASRFFPIDLPTESRGIKLDFVLRPDSGILFFKNNYLFNHILQIQKITDFFYTTCVLRTLPLIKKDCGLVDIKNGNHICFIDVDLAYCTKKVIKYYVTEVINYDDYSWYLTLVHNEEIEIKNGHNN